MLPKIIYIIATFLKRVDNYLKDIDHELVENSDNEWS